MKKLVVLLFATFFVVSASVVSFAGEWKQDNIGWWYLNDDGTSPTSTWKDGENSVGGVSPYVDDTEQPYYYTSRTFEKVKLDKAAFAKTFNNMPGWDGVWYNNDVYKIKI